MPVDSIISELRQRHVFRVAAVYAVVAWLLLQLCAIVLPTFEAPAWVMKVITVLLALGFPLALMLAWAFDASPQGITSADSSTNARPARSRRPIIAVGVLGTLLAATAAGAWWWWQQPTESAVSSIAAKTETANAAAPMPQETAGVDPHSVAVLPFESLSANPANAYFASGLQDFILTKLSLIDGLQVVSRTSTEKYGSHPANVQTIANELGVATILEGSVQRADNQVLVNVQLIDAASDAHIWAKSYQRKLDDIFGVEGEIATKVAGALEIHLSPDETRQVSRKPTTNPEAYKLYLKASYESKEYLAGKRQVSRLEQAVKYLERAIELDPQFALAYASLGNVQSIFLLNGLKESEALRDSALRNARMAIALQPDLAMAHLSLGTLLMDQDPADALVQFRKAAQLSPNDPRAPFLIAQLQVMTGQWQQAQEAIDKALNLDPRNPRHYGWAYLIQAALHDYEQAQQILELGLAANPSNAVLRSNLASLMQLRGELQAAEKEMLKLPDRWPFKNVLLTQLYQLRGDYQQALKSAQAVLPLPGYASAGARELLIARSALALGMETQAKAALGKARSLVEAALTEHPDSPRLHSTLASIEMWRGNRQAALEAVDRALTLASQSMGMSRVWLPRERLTKAKILAHFGDAEGAGAILKKLLTTPGGGLVISPAMLRLNPIWDPIRDKPGFEALLVDFPKKKNADEAQRSTMTFVCPRPQAFPRRHDPGCDLRQAYS